MTYEHIITFGQTFSARMISLTAFIISFNEEKNIARCIQSLKPVADEIIVVDSFSTDKTTAIAAELGAKVIQRTFTGYGDQKFFAQEQSGSDWVFSIDADEVLTEELQASILKMKAAPGYDAYEVNRLSSYCGKWIRHCGWYPQYILRIWNRTKGSITRDEVHESVQLTDKKTTIGKLKGDLLHYTYDTISEHIRKIERYTEAGARNDVARGKSCSLLKLLVVPKWQFFTTYILQLGFLDGYYGYILCRNSSFAAFLKYSKIRQYRSLKKRGLAY
jgi:glycosyltransferase involved in cell wall biosynthesis